MTDTELDKIFRRSKEYSSHNDILIKALFYSQGSVCEVGSGLFSTPLLHWMCKAMDRRLITYENDEFYYQFAKRFRSPLHRINKVNDWGEMDFNQHWGVVFIDHCPPQQRAIDAIRFKDHADFIVMHDTTYFSNYYIKAWPFFKYRYDWTGWRTGTTVASNFYPVDKFADKLPCLI
jgi:hypothetical protein